MGPGYRVLHYSKKTVAVDERATVCICVDRLTTEYIPVMEQVYRNVYGDNGEISPDLLCPFFYADYRPLVNERCNFSSWQS